MILTCQLSLNDSRIPIALVVSDTPLSALVGPHGPESVIGVQDHCVIHPTRYFLEDAAGFIKEHWNIT